MNRHSTSTYLKRLLLTIGIIGLFTVLVLVSWALVDVFLLLFLGVLIAIILRTLANFLAGYTPLQPKWALLVVVAVLLILLAVSGWFFIPELANQTEQLVDRTIDTVNQAEAFLRQYDWGERFVERVLQQNNRQLIDPNLVNRVTNTLTLTLTIVGHTIFVFFVGIFVALDPQLYRSGILHLIPPRGRKRGREVLNEVVQGLRSWLVGQVISMLVVGVVITVGLWLLDVPLAFALGVLSALLEFVPIAGPIIAAIPGIAIALPLGFRQAIYVTLFYFVIQQLEGNILTPIVQQQVVSLPPVVTLTAVLGMGFLFGPLGVLVATPLAVVVFILIKMLYLEDILGQEAATMDN